MSHQEERKEKNCLNCNAEVFGRFCEVCGQENIEPKESFWSLVTHFIYDITHFDGKFFSTLKSLLFKPGLLSMEYIRGKRVSYLHPIRLYVFTSFVFFLIYFSFYQEKEIIQLKESKSSLAKDIKSLEKKRDSIPSLQKDNKIFQIGDQDFGEPKTIAQYDSLQLLLPEKKRDGYFIRMIQHKSILLSIKYNYDKKAVWKGIVEKFTHLFPQLLFVSLPLFSFFLFLLYIRRKSIYYVDHVVFTIHLYCATFILFLLSLLIGSLMKLIHINEDISNFLFFMLVVIYWYKAFRGFYTQSRKKTILKYFILFFMTMLLIGILFTSFLLLSFLTI